MAKKYTDEFLLNELHRAYDILGHVPRAEDMHSRNGLVSEQAYYTHFGSFKNALIKAGFNFNSKQQYSDQFLIDEIHRFISENGKSPKMSDMRPENGYPHADTYTDRFGSWNNSLKMANVKINLNRNSHLPDEICSICHKPTSRYWDYKDDKLVCEKCYRRRDFIEGVLSPTSTTGKGLISEYVVYTILNDCVQCNIDISFNYKYDLISKTYGTINVKSSKLYKSADANSYYWCFRITKVSKIPDYYICLGFDDVRSEIQHVWIIPSNSDLVQKTCVITLGKLKRASKYEIDATPYNEVYKELDICSFSEFKNFKDIDNDITQEIL